MSCYQNRADTRDMSEYNSQSHGCLTDQGHNHSIYPPQQRHALGPHSDNQDIVAFLLTSKAYCFKRLSELRKATPSLV